jgi:hypothetical protein
MILLTFYFLIFVSFTPLVYGMEDEIKVEMEMSETLEDAPESFEAFFKGINSDYYFQDDPLITIEDLNEQCLSSYKPDIPIPPPKSI